MEVYKRINTLQSKKKNNPWNQPATRIWENFYDKTDESIVRK